MKALSLTQPWATLVISGEKKIETRSWKTSYQGIIAVHAAQRFGKLERSITMTGRYFQESLKKVCKPDAAVPLGAILGTVEIFGYLHTETIVSDYEFDVKLFRQFSLDPFTEKERSFGDYAPNRYGWILRNPRPLTEPIPCKGALSLWQVPDEIEIKLLDQSNYFEGEK